MIVSPIHISTLITHITQQLSRVHNAYLSQQYAWHIAQAITGLSKAHLLAKHTITLSNDQKNTLNDWIIKHTQQSMPLAYLIGSVPFINATITVKPPILIPRPETEEWVARLITQIKKSAIKELRILDMCTGSGCIAIALAQAFPYAQLYAADISPDALHLARHNAVLNNITNITFIESDLFQSLAGATFDIIVSNPPYISQEEWTTLDISVKNWEDPQALIAADHGLAIIKDIITNAPQHLHNNPLYTTYGIPQMIIEFGSAQGPAVANIAAHSSFKSYTIIKDAQLHDRIITLNK